jgi:hypothetical protein
LSALNKVGNELAHDEELDLRPRQTGSGTSIRKYALLASLYEEYREAGTFGKTSCKSSASSTTWQALHVDTVVDVIYRL